MAAILHSPSRVWIIVALVLSTSTSNAQKRNAHWAIAGKNLESYPGSLIGGMNDIPSVAVSIPHGNSESSAAISDTSGSLLFYAARGRIFRTNGEEMFITFGGYLNLDVTQGQLILPRPGSDSLYDVLMIDVSPDSTISTLRKPKALHMVVDITADAGAAAVVSDEVSFGYNLTERLTGTPHANGTDYWVLMHEWKSDKFLAHQISADGLDTIPVVSHAGAVQSADYGGCATSSNRQGEMKCSYQGDLIAVTSLNWICGSDTLRPGLAQVFHFDDATGLVAYWFTLPMHHQAYGVEFSQDGGKLYLPGIDSLVRYVDQYDLLAGDTTAIKDSRTRIFSIPFVGTSSDPTPSAMELAPNGKIYVTHTGNSLDAINAPNAQGLACDYVQDAILFPNPHSQVGHTNQIKRYHDSEFNELHTGFGLVTQPAHFAIWPNPASSSIRLRMPMNLVSPLVRIHDSTGRLLREVSGQVTLSGSMDVSGLASGLYSVSLLDGSAVVGQARLVIQ